MSTLQLLHDTLNLNSFKFSNQGAIRPNGSPPEVSRPRKPNRPPSDVTVNTGTPTPKTLISPPICTAHGSIARSSSCGCGRAGTAAVSPCSCTHATPPTATRSSRRRRRFFFFCSGRALSRAMGDSLACTRFFLLLFFSSSPGPPHSFLVGVFFFSSFSDAA